MVSKKRYHATGVRLEDDLYEDLRKLAFENRRTVSSQLNTSLRLAIKGRVSEDKLDVLRSLLETIILGQSKIVKAVGADLESA